MSYVVCPKCDEKIYIYGKKAKEEIEKQYDLPLLARIPFDGEMTSLIDEGKVEYINKDYVDELVYKIEEKLKEKE